MPTATPPPAPFAVTEQGRDVAISFPAGTVLTEDNAHDVGRRLVALVEGRDRPRLTLDLSGVVMLTSVALAKFVTLNGRVRAAGGRLTLANPTPLVTGVLKITRLDTILEVAAA